ncbi:hypothetical protein JRO89_XS04G0171800 [Xanthoceras sorbifolium]|uniref:Protein kinase domain-containing protein n=1 Tax=Xanthoceras sorbifolium TaxID=99658 RepID=A0ABQ8I5N4_9ROSI|nr:hypothetical protein JRO89_XS04G0171800 [Xanthoceras sorbifolium]
MICASTFLNNTKKYWKPESAARALSRHQRLERIIFTRNKLIDIKTLHNELNLVYNGLAGELPEELGSLHALERLRAGESRITGSIPPEIGNLHNLKILNLHNNSLAGLIPSIIFNISKLESIGLYMNRLSGPLPSTIGLRLPNLKELILWDNELNGIIPGSISNASKLTILELSSDSFSGPIPTALGHLRNLQRLNLASNQLTRESSTQELTFLSSLTNCNFLTRLVLKNNPLSGTLSVSIGNLYALESFLVDSCKIKGSIPYEVVGLSNLTTLRLTNNDLTGLIPTAVGKMRKLQVLSFEGNRLQGSIPIEVCHLRNLGELYLGGKKLFGPIPACLGDVTSLRVLYLNSNNLTSTIPSSLWSLKDILDLNLFTNSLRGHLSLDIEKLKVVTQIDLSGNELSESLDLSSNNLSGVIPKSLDKLRYFKDLNLSFNRLEGEIPTEGPFTNFSAGSFMGNSEICGASQLQVPQCKTHALQEPKKKKASVMKSSEEKIKIFRRRRCVNYSSHMEKNLISRTSKCNKRIPGKQSTWYKRFWLSAQRKIFGWDDIAVKVFNLQVDGVSKSFDDECEVMSKIRHRNLVKIISSCSNIDFKALVLEYMPNGSLETWLYSHNYCLDTLQRLNIMIDVTLALEYLHHDYATPIVHCDLKPSNRACHGWLPSMEVLAKKRVPVDGLCPLCKVSLETPLHAIWNCSSLRVVRKACVGVHQVVFNDNMPVLEFVIWCHDHVNQLQLETLCIVWWRVWFCRNRAIHSSSFFPVSEVMPWSSAYLAEYQAANLKPTLNPLAVNVREKKVGLGVVIRNASGVVVAAGSRCSTSLLSVASAEAEAIIFGINLAVDQNLFPVMVESDAAEVICFIQDKAPPLSEVGILVSEILRLADSHNLLCFAFCPCLGNSVAHGIAKFAISSSASGFWLGVSPPCGEEAIVADVASDL